MIHPTSRPMTCAWGTRLAAVAVTVLLCGAAPSVGLAAEAPEKDEEAKQAEAKAEESLTLVDRMERIAESYTALARAFRPPDAAKIDEYLIHAKKLKAEALKARALEPSGFAALPEDERKTLLIAYRKEMDSTIKTLDALVVALNKNDLTAANTLVRKLRQHRTEGHKKFQIDG